jgi:drug/metabolite transporter (DMT)-like permease
LSACVSHIPTDGIEPDDGDRCGILERPWQLPMSGVVTWLAVLGLAALSTALAYIVFFQILRRSGATNVMLVTLLVPVTAILLGALVLGEHISLRETIGALVIGSALLLIDGRVLKLFGRWVARRGSA